MIYCEIIEHFKVTFGLGFILDKLKSAIHNSTDETFRRSSGSFTNRTKPILHFLKSWIASVLLLLTLHCPVFCLHRCLWKMLFLCRDNRQEKKKISEKNEILDVDGVRSSTCFLRLALNIFIFVLCNWHFMNSLRLVGWCQAVSNVFYFASRSLFNRIAICWCFSLLNEKFIHIKKCLIAVNKNKTDCI